MTFSNDDNDDAPDEPIQFAMKCETMTKNSESSLNHKLIPRSKEDRDELTFSASDNDDTPKSPILFPMECGTMTNNNESSLNHKINCQI